MTGRVDCRLLAAVLVTTMLAACGRPAPPPTVAPGRERYPEYTRPELPAELARMVQPARQHTLGWAQLQSGDPRGAEKAFREVLRRQPRFYPTQTALAYARLAQGDADDALTWFDRALGVQGEYVSALLGRAEALVALGREGEAFEAYQNVLERVPDDPVARRRVEVLRFKAVQSDVAAAQAAVNADAFDEAREHYLRAIKATPDSAFLHRDLADVERRLGRRAEARTAVDRAISLDPQDAKAYVIRGELKASGGDGTGALEDYRRARDLDPGLTEIADRISALERSLAEAALPAEYKAIATSARVTRGEVAALLAQRLPTVLEQAARGTVLITDSRRHWAQDGILLVARARAMEVYPNHTFQPGAPMSRGDFALVVDRVLNLLGPSGANAPWREARLTFSDIRPGHRSYVAVSRAVASGVMTPLEGQAFGPGRPMTGAAAVEAVDRLAQLAQRLREQ